MVVIHDGAIELAGQSYNLPLAPAPPFWTLEYVSKNNKRKDYVDNMRRYERDLKVPYYLLFEPLKQKLAIYHHDGEHFSPLTPNAHGRLEIPELNLEVAIHDRWVRFWYKAKLLPLPADLQNDLDETRKERDQMKNERDEATQRAENAERENARLREQLKKQQNKKNGSR
jgi:hypothetical protein